MSNKAVYTTPKLVELGTFEELTQATSVGGDIDGVYPIQTPFKGHQDNVS